MTPLIFLDIAVAPRASESSAFVAYLIGVFVIIVVIETIILRLLGWGDFRRSFVDALIMNLVTTLLGALGLFIVPDLVFLLPAALVLSILIEGLILMRRHKEHSLRKIWLTSIVANVVSYILVFFLPLFF